MEAKVVAGFLEALKVGKKQSVEGLTIYPLFTEMPGTYEYLTLDEALKAKILLVGEKSVGVTVPEIEVNNQSEKDVLMIDGEELVGAKQNRILNISIMVGAKTAVTIPVSCVEAGRWASHYGAFQSAERMAYGGLRAKKAASVHRSVAANGTFRSDQSEVWNDIACKTAEFKMESSPTGAMHHIYEKKEKDLEKIRKAFKVEEDQAGAVFALGGEILGADIFDRPSTFQKLFPKILDSYIMELLVAEKKDSAPQQKEVQDFLVAASKAIGETHKSPGIGVSVSIKSPEMVGASLVVNGLAVHTAIFKQQEGKEDGPVSRLSRPSSRRGNYIE